MSAGEIVANVLNLASVLMAGRNSVHTWWLGILGCGAFCWVFFESKLYADVTLQIFFIGASAVGWWNWKRGSHGRELPVRRTPLRWFIACALMAALAAAGYGWVLHTFTDAWSPFIDSLVLAFSVLAQFLLMGRRIENWPCWLVVNTLAVPLFASRHLYLTAAVYALFWINAIISWRHWWKLLEHQRATPVV
ncbi:MAG TPA: nicotinamide riboside transporter PnuC [Candidatus Saccharimonadia bacterium]|nr:nicotinamide riboside transporter PnuC [Candidatus Saccharimonadia bacterium]